MSSLRELPSIRGLLLGCIALLLSGCAETPQRGLPGGSPPDGGTYGPAPPRGSLRAAAETAGRRIGVALSPRISSDARYAELAAADFNCVTAEYQMKWDPTELAPGQFNYTLGDQLVTFAEANGMAIRGHALVWHEALPAWVKALPDAASVDAALKNHIQNVVTHWKGKIYAWDVVNEAIADGTGMMRPSIFLEKLGPEYVEKAFRYAREADPDVKLYYNDYGGEAPGPKANGIFDLVKRLVDAGAPIDGVGFQMHIAANQFPGSTFAATMQRFVDLGLTVNVSEMDVRVYGVAGGLDAKLAAGAATYREMAAACMAQPRCDAFTVWGLTDNVSWINSASVTFFPKPDYPLLFDEAYMPKPAYTALVDVFSGR